MKKRTLILNSSDFLFVDDKYNIVPHSKLDLSKYSKYPIDTVRNVNFPLLKSYTQKYHYNITTQTIELLGNVPINNKIEIIYYSKAEDRNSIIEEILK